tara:strand:- start:249 stop:1022 length:774 start_codon:yes stop_codon:yes gene_type:complete
MATQTDQEWLTQAYLDTFNRTPDLNSAGGAQYWLDQMAADQTGHSRANVLNALQQSAEGKSYAKDQVVRPGGVDRSKSTVSQADNEYLKSISGLGQNNANILNTIAANTFMGDGSGTATTDNVAGGYFQASDNDIIDGGGGGNSGDDSTTAPAPAPGGWWTQFDDADAFKEFLTGGQQQNGMDDFMKFMMLMSVMGGGRGGGGYGGSQYGYGGLNPGGVMQAYDPLAQLQGMGTWFKDNFGSGGATTNTVNTGTAGN